MVFNRNRLLARILFKGCSYDRGKNDRLSAAWR